MREEPPVSEKLLQTLHNLCATAPELARKSEELAGVLQLDITEVENILDNYGSDGYVERFNDNEGKRRYYLTGKGIIKVCAFFT